jgi:purine-binding chemotaxis protein CheW
MAESAENSLPVVAQPQGLVLDEMGQYLTFRVQGERFAIAILEVNEIIEAGAMTRVPMAPVFIQGVINLRGSVVPVINLAARLGRSNSQLSKHSCIVLVDVSVDGETQMVGMLVDEVNEILEIAQGHMLPAPDFGTDIRTDFIQCMGRVEDRFIILLDMNRVLSIKELSELMRPSGS